jgi:hypothetical protein
MGIYDIVATIIIIAPIVDTIPDITITQSTLKTPNIVQDILTIKKIMNDTKETFSEF